MVLCFDRVCDIVYTVAHKECYGFMFWPGFVIKYVLKRVSFGSKDCTKELKLECAYFLGQTS